MRRKNREINIFSTSSLDLFASAMGAFILIAVMALPYYMKTDPNIREKMKKLTEEIAKKSSENETLKKENKALKKENKALKSESFCVVKMEWNSKNYHDIDLYVTDPSGKTFYFAKPYFTNDKDASLTVDAGGSSLLKKGAEVWMTKKLKQGTYTIKYNYYNGTKPVKVQGFVVTKTFSKKIPTLTMNHSTKGNVKVKVATIVVDANGNVTLNTY